MTSTVLLTGASGLVGFKILQKALSAGHTVRCTVRSLSKAEIITSSPVIQKLSPGPRLSFVTVPDICADGAYDTALKDITHVIHVGSPVHVPGLDPKTEIYFPIVKSNSTLLDSALKTPTIQRIIITSSILANVSPTDASKTPIPTNPSTRIQLPAPEYYPPFANVISAYHTGKIEALNATDTFVREKKPHFSIAHVISGYVFGRNDLITEAGKARSENSSNNLLLHFLSGVELPFQLYGGYAYLEDVADVHMEALDHTQSVKDKSITQNYGVSRNVVFEDAFGYVEKAFPAAVKEGIFKKGKMPTLPIDWDASETAKELGGVEYHGFEKGVVDAAGQYLELLGKPKA